jgi:Flp pilus assembly pilin Flp
MKTILQRFACDDGGQDLIEYALLGALIGIGGIVAWTNVGTAILGTYSGWDTSVQALSSCTPDPSGGGC